MPPGAFVREEVFPLMPPGACFKEEVVVKREHAFVVYEGGSVDGHRGRRARRCAWQRPSVVVREGAQRLVKLCMRLGFAPSTVSLAGLSPRGLALPSRGHKVSIKPFRRVHSDASVIRWAAPGFHLLMALVFYRLAPSVALRARCCSTT